MSSSSSAAPSSSRSPHKKAKHGVTEQEIQQLREQARAKYELQKSKLQKLVERENESFEFQPIRLDPKYKSTEESTASDEFVPVECMALILGYIDPLTLCKTVRFVCRGWALLAKYDDIWEHHFKIYFPVSPMTSEAVAKSFSGWFEAFGFRYQLRNKWKSQKYTELTYLDFMEHEYKRGSRQNPFIRNDITSEEPKKLVRFQVSAVSMSNDKIAVGDCGGRIKIWSVRTKQALKEFKTRTAGQIMAVALDSKRLVSSGNADTRLLVWDLKTGLLLTELKRTTPNSTTAPAGYGGRYATTLKLVNNTLFALFSDASTEIWDLQLLKLKTYIKPVAQVDQDQFGHHGHDLVDTRENMLITNFGDDTIRVYDLRIPGGICIKNICLSPPLKTATTTATTPAPTIPTPATAPVLPTAAPAIPAPAPAPVAAPPTPEFHYIVYSIKLAEDNLSVGVLLQEQHIQSGMSQILLKHLDIKTGKERLQQRVRFIIPSTQVATITSGQFDQDKVLFLANYGSEIFVHDRASGIQFCRVPTIGNAQKGAATLSYSASGIVMTCFESDEMRMAIGTNIGGIVYRSFASSNMYWSDLEGGKTLAGSSTSSSN